MLEQKLRELEENKIKELDLYYNEAKISYSLLTYPFSDCDLPEVINRLNKDDIKKLAIALKKNTSLEVLNLSNNKIGCEGLFHLCEALKINTNIKKLVLSNNQIGVDGTQYLSEILEGKNSIELIDLSGNNIGDKGVKHISKAIPHNRKLKQIILDTNSITDEGAKSLLEAFKLNYSIIKLSIKAYDVKAIKQELEKNPSLPDITCKPGFNLENKISNELEQKIKDTINSHFPHGRFNFFNIKTKKLNSDYCDIKVVTCSAYQAS